MWILKQSHVTAGSLVGSRLCSRADEGYTGAEMLNINTDNNNNNNNNTSQCYSDFLWPLPSITEPKFIFIPSFWEVRFVWLQSHSNEVEHFESSGSGCRFKDFASNFSRHAK